MKVLLLGLICLSVQTLFAGEDRPFKDVLSDYMNLQRQLDELLKAKVPECLPDGKTTKACSMAEICSLTDKLRGGPYLYHNENGERIFNTEFFLQQNDLKKCLTEKYAVDIKEKRDEAIKKSGARQLKAIVDQNKYLNGLIAKHGQSKEVQKVSSAILELSLSQNEDGVITDKWESKNKDALLRVLKNAEKKAKVSLNPKIETALIDLQILKRDTKYKDQLDGLEKQLLPMKGLDDQFINEQLVYSAETAGGEQILKKNRDELNKVAQKSYETFEEVKKDYLSYFEKKDPAKFARIVERIKLLKFNPPNFTKTVLDTCSSPNAYYDPRNHSVTVCPSMMVLPKMALYEVLAHEFAHSFDSCSLTSIFYKHKLPPKIEEAPFEIEVKMQTVRGNFENYFYEPEDKDPTRILQQKMPFKDHPFYETISCLESSESIGAVQTSKEKMKEAIGKQKAQLQEVGQFSDLNQQARYLKFLDDNLDEFMTYAGGCDLGVENDLGNSQLEESFADKMSTELIAMKMKAMSAKESSAMLSHFVNSLGMCSNELPAENLIRTFAVKEGCKDYFENRNTWTKITKGLSIAKPAFNTHPNGAKRIEKIFLAHPDIRKSLNCTQASGAKYCE